MRVRVIRTSTTPADEAALVRLLSEADLQIEDVEQVMSEEEEAVLDDLVEEQVWELGVDEGNPVDEDDEELYVPEDVYVVVLTDECIDDEETDKAIRQSSTCGQVVGIWPEGSTHGRVPPALDRLGGSLVPWNAEVLKETIARGVPTWREPSGDYRAEPKTKRNKC